MISGAGKLYTSLLNSCLVEYVESNNILADEQNGFRPGRSCTDHVFLLSALVHNRLNENKSTVAAVGRKLTQYLALITTSKDAFINQMKIGSIIVQLLEHGNFENWPVSQKQLPVERR